ncbi:hypothetical protein FOA52_003617 [Chlamydomonas sp. UWO 241]|nr:hypothetical protein FOA52_003617 [Chlamydomonas sp. UWO 241]
MLMILMLLLGLLLCLHVLVVPLQWRIEDFSKLTSELVLSSPFQAGGRTWMLVVFPSGRGKDAGTHLSVGLFVRDNTVITTAEYKFTLVNQADTSNSHSRGGTSEFLLGDSSTYDAQFFKLSELRDAGAGWLVCDGLVLTVEVTEDIFQLDAGGAPCDVTLQLPSGVEVPVLDRCHGTWTYILKYLYPQYESPALTLSSAYTLLPVVHKYNFPKLLTRLIDFVKGNNKALSRDPSDSVNYIVRWLALAERLQLDELQELCLHRMQGMTREQLQSAITVEVEAVSGGKQKKHAVRKEMLQLGHALLAELPSITAPATLA